MKTNLRTRKTNLKAVKKYQQTEKGRESNRKCCKRYANTLIGCLKRKFADIKKRCDNPKVQNYEYYGGRGIKCLFKNADEFIDYVLNELQVDPRGLDVDRINNNGNYEPGNIQFITHKENCRKGE